VAVTIRTDGPNGPEPLGRAVTPRSAIRGGGDHQNFDVAPDGRRFLIVRPNSLRAVVATRWVEELRARVAP
jgi:hypothetical protein